MNKTVLELKDFEIQYMGKKCTIEDCVKYRNNIQKCEDLSKIAPITYINSIVENIELDEDEICTDTIIEVLNNEIAKDEHRFNFVVLKVIITLEIKELPFYIKTILESRNEDEKFDLFLKWLRELNID